MQFQAFAPEDTVCMREENPFKDPGTMPRRPEYVRYVSKRPIAKTFKAVGDGACFSDAARIMFREVHGFSDCLANLWQ